MKLLVSTLCLAGFIALVSQTSKGQGASQYPMVDKLADKIILKYQTSSCEQLKEQKAQKAEHPDAQKDGMEEKIAEQLKKDPAMRKHFLDKVAGPVANKMFECGMIM